MTETATIPGLETAGTAALPHPERIIEHPGGKRLMLFSGRSNRLLAEDIAAHLGIRETAELSRLYVSIYGEEPPREARTRFAAILGD